MVTTGIFDFCTINKQFINRENLIRDNINMQKSLPTFRRPLKSVGLNKQTRRAVIFTSVSPSWDSVSPHDLCDDGPATGYVRMNMEANTNRLVRCKHL